MTSLIINNMDDIESIPLVDFVPKKQPQILAALAANIAAFCLGNICGWASTGVPSLVDSGTFPVTIDEQSWITSLASLACMVAVFPAGAMIEKFGRQQTIIILCLPFTAGWLLITYSTNVTMLCVGRFITGMCGGAVGVAAPVYIGETVEPHIRGFLGSCFQLMIVTGILFSYIIGLFATWQYQALISAFPPVLCLIAMVLVPESPRYLLSVGRKAEAVQSLIWLRGAKNSEQVEQEIELIEQNAELNNLNVASLEALCVPSIYKPVLVAIGLMTCQELCGIDAISNYTVNIFREAGSNIDPNVSTIIMGVVQVIATCAALPLVDKAGRKLLLLITDVIMAIALGVLGLFFYWKDNKSDVDSVGWLPLACLVIYIAAFSMGIGPVGWTMIGEILPSSVVGMASAIATCVLWSLSFLILQFFEDISHAFGNAGSFWFFAIATTLSIAFVCFCVPETKGKTLEEIQDFFNVNRRSILTLVDPKPKPKTP